MDELVGVAFSSFFGSSVHRLFGSVAGIPLAVASDSVPEPKN
jgi:hypothetical protein